MVDIVSIPFSLLRVSLRSFLDQVHNTCQQQQKHR